MNVPIADRVGNMVRLGEVLQVLASNGFAHLLHTSGLSAGLPAKLLRELSLIEAKDREPETVGRRLRRVLTQLGPTFVKVGQILATRPDLLDEEVCDELARLQDRAGVRPFSEIRPALERALGGPYDEVLAALDPEPVAAASISQVYRGRLASGEEVAVKVQRPGIAEVIESDLRLLRALAGWVGRDTPLGLTDPEGTVDEFARSIRRELDFHQERRVLARFVDDFDGDPRVRVPRPFPALCSEKVLVLEWIDGARIDDLAAYPARGSDPKTVAVRGVEIVCKQVFEHRFFHADPHPGNIVLTRDDQIAFLDYGMVGHLARGDVEAMADLLRAVIEEDAEACVRLIRTFTAAGYLDDPLSLQHEVAEYLAFEARAILDGGRVGAAIDALTAILRRHNLELAPRFGLLLKALATIEVTARTLDPSLEIVPILEPFIRDLVLARYAPARLAGKAQEELAGAFRLMKSLPDDVQAIVAQTRRGRLRVTHEVGGHRELAEAVERASARLSFALVLGALILGSSWLLTTNVVADNLGIAGYVAALVLALWLAVSVFRGFSQRHELRP